MIDDMAELAEKVDSADALRLIDELAPNPPLLGSDDYGHYCFFCFKDIPGWGSKLGDKIEDHTPDCVWVKARTTLGDNLS